MSSLQTPCRAAAAAVMVLLSGMQAACGDDDGSGGAGGNGGAGGSGAAGGSGPSALCSSDVSGQATPVNITVRNTGTTDLQVPTMCADAWVVEAPGGAAESRGWFSVRCEEPPTDCPADCFDFSFEPLEAGSETTFIWDGLLMEQVDAVAERCPAAQPEPGTFCPITCGREVDAAPGMYTLTVELFEDGASLPLKTVTFSYPDETDLEVVFP